MGDFMTRNFDKEYTYELSFGDTTKEFDSRKERNRYIKENDLENYETNVNRKTVSTYWGKLK